MNKQSYIQQLHAKISEEEEALSREPDSGPRDAMLRHRLSVTSQELSDVLTEDELPDYSARSTAWLAKLNQTT